MQAARALLTTGLSPKRTVRVVLFTNEEHGLTGAFAYAERHKERHVAAIEADFGGGMPLGFSVEAAPGEEVAVARLFAPLAGLIPLEIETGGSGADLIPLVERGVPGLGLEPDGTHYFDVHHTDADTLEKIQPRAVSQQAATMAAAAWILAENDVPLRGVKTDKSDALGVEHARPKSVAPSPAKTRSSGDGATTDGTTAEPKPARR
jgi:Zn-dependent M28 family amino/carboxypeptidase